RGLLMKSFPLHSFSKVCLASDDGLECAFTNPYRQAPLWAAGTAPQRLDIGERHSYAAAQSWPTRHVLASGTVNSGQVKKELVTPTGKPPFVVVTWPLKPSAMSPAAYSDAAAQLCRLFTAPSVALSHRRAWENRRAAETAQTSQNVCSRPQGVAGTTK